MDDNINWDRAFRPGQVELKAKPEPLADPIVSQIVGRKIAVNDPKLMALIIKWRNNKDPEQFDNFMQDPAKIEELKQTFNVQS